MTFANITRDVAAEFRSAQRLGRAIYDRVSDEREPVVIEATAPTVVRRRRIVSKEAA